MAETYGLTEVKMHHGKLLKGKMLVSAAAIGATIITLSSASTAQASAAARQVGVSAAIVIPNETLHWEYSGNNYPDTSTGRHECASRGNSYVRSGEAYQYQCTYDDPVANRINLWIEVYI